MTKNDRNKLWLMMLVRAARLIRFDSKCSELFEDACETTLGRALTDDELNIAQAIANEIAAGLEIRAEQESKE